MMLYTTIVVFSVLGTLVQMTVFLYRMSQVAAMKRNDKARVD
jgi:hypothetical protein